MARSGVTAAVFGAALLFGGGAAMAAHSNAGDALNNRFIIKDSPDLTAVTQARAGGGGTSFGVIQGGHFKYNSGSHVDVNGVNLVAGVSKRLARTDSALTTGGFIEGGWSSHKTYNRFDDRDVRGKGNARYIGVGGLIHDQWDNGLHAEGAVRIGHGHTDWHSNDLLMDGRSAVHAAYSTSGIYYGAHAGVLEVGVNMRPGSATGLHIDVGVQGYAGRRQGVAGTARLEWQF